MQAKFIAVVLVVIVVAALGGILSYHGTTNNHSTSTTTQSSYTSNVAVTSSSTSKSSSVSSTATGAMLSSIPEPISTAPALFGNFSQLTMQIAFTNGSTVSNVTYSYSVVGHPTINGTQLTEVSFAIADSQGNNTQLTVYYDSNYSAVMVTMYGQNVTGFAAEIGGSFLLVYTQIFPNIQNEIGLNSTGILPYLQMVGTKTQTFGNLQMEVTTYAISDFNYSGNVIKSATISIGTIPGSAFSMLTSIYSNYVVNGTDYSISFQLVSATRTS